MKKLFSMLLVFSLCFTVLSCGSGKEKTLSKNSENQEEISSISLEEHSDENIDAEEELDNESVDSFSIESKPNNVLEWTQWEYPEQYEVVSFTKEISYKEKGSEFIVDGRYPQIDGMEDIPFQIRINKALKGLIKSRMGNTTVYPKCLDQVRDYYFEEFGKFDAQYDEFGDMYRRNFPEIFCFNYDYKIALFTEDILSVIYTIHFQIGCTAAYDCALPITFDLKNKEIYKDPQDYFVVEDYWETIEPLFVEELTKKLTQRQGFSNYLESRSFKFDKVYPYISFALSAEGLLVMYDENEANSMETMHMACIPYEKVSTILKPNLIYSGNHKDFFSYFSAIDGWTEYDFDPSKYEAKSNFMIKYPNNCTLSKLEDDSVKIDIPSDYGMISILISKEEHSLSGNDEFDIDGYDFEIELDSVKNSADIVGTVRGEPYRIEIIFPYSKNDTEKKIMIGKVNKILSTMRFSMILR